MINIIQNKKIPFIISGILFTVSVIILFVFGLRQGIDFTGGSLLEIRFTKGRPSIQEVQEVLSPLNFGNIIVQPSDRDKMIIRSKFLTENEHQQVLSALRSVFDSQSDNTKNEFQADGGADTGETINKNGGTGDLSADFKQNESGIEKPDNDKDIVPPVLVDRFETIGPTISEQLRKRSFSAAIAVVLAIIFYIAYAFRKVSKPVQSWKYGITAIIALIHDTIITMAVFSILGKYWGVEIDIPFVVALLTIMGYSVNDTIVVFDRVRENLIKRGSNRFAETVNLGVNQTLVRSLNTSLTTLIVLLALFFFGGGTIHYFSLTLVIGIIIGTYSSIFLASPLLVIWASFKHRS